MLRESHSTTRCPTHAAPPSRAATTPQAALRLPLRPTALLLVVFLVVNSLAPGAAFAQRRRKPVLRAPSRDYYAGRLLLVPRDSRPSSWQLPRLVARIADHEIILPPRSLLGGPAEPADVERVVSWAKSQNYNELAGVIVSLDLLAFGSGGAPADAVTPEVLKQKFGLVEWIRAERPNLPVYGFTARGAGAGGAGGDAALRQVALDLVAKGLLTNLFIEQPESAAGGGAGEALQSAAASPALGDRVHLVPPFTEAAAVLAARHLNLHYRRPLKVLPIYPGAGDGARAVSQAVDAQLAAIGGTRLTLPAPDQSPVAVARQADVLLFVYPPDAGEAAGQSLVDEITRAASAGYYVAVADLSEKSDERLMKELRQRKMLDLVVAYAGGGGAGNGPGGGAARAVGLALAQAAARLISAKFLRDDIDRLQRIERSQVELLFTRYLEDWGYARKVRPQLEEHARESLKADPLNLGAAAEKAEEFARRELTLLAEGLFNEQFRRNIHSVLHPEAGRVEFMLHSLQRFQFRLPWGRADVPEVVPRIYVSLYTIPPSYLNK
jgi:hypothetical protein